MRVVILAPPMSQVLDITGPLEPELRKACDELLGKILSASTGVRRIPYTPEVLPAGVDLAFTFAGLEEAAENRALTMGELRSWMEENLHGDLSVSALASRCAMSPRHFARIFLRETGATPARFVERLRVESASRRLEESADTVGQIAASCGFGSADSMRRVFVRLHGHTPSELRASRQRLPVFG
jgi:AraC-like DNA-binding protein